MRITLTVLSGPCEGLRKEFSPAPKRIRIGRDPTFEFSLRASGQQDRGLSREHCQLEVGDSICTIRDLGSNNGVRVNDRERVSTKTLQTGDRIRLSRSTEIRIEITFDHDDNLTVDQPTRDSFHEAFELLPVGPCIVCTTPRPLQGEVCPSCREQRNRAAQPIPGYLLLREIGTGGMGVVWLAEDRAKQRYVAIKMIRPVRGTPQGQVRRFLHELGYLRDLKHPNIVGTVPPPESDAQRDPLHLVMEYIPGIDGATFLQQRGPLEVALAVRIIRDVLAGLSYAHSRRCIHRDLKPANILIVEDPWTVKLADFGLAYQAQNSSVSRLTQTSELGGTLLFLPPEQSLGMIHATAASDQYGVAATLYNLLTGKTVHDLPRTLAAQLDMILKQPAIPIRRRRPELSPALAAVIHRALELEPENRYPDVDSFSRALGPFSR